MIVVMLGLGSKMYSVLIEKSKEKELEIKH